jgi:hypothetical protein
MKTSESIKSIGAAMLNFQSSVSKITKSADNPFFKSKYAPLSDILQAIHKPLLDSGLVVMQFPSGHNELETIVMHPESGEWMSETYYMKPVKEDPQAYGSVITYQRRYALGAILGLNIDEDDDGNKGSDLTNKADKPRELQEMSEKEYNRLLDNIRSGKYLENEADQLIKEIEKKRTIKREHKEGIKHEMQLELNKIMLNDKK